MASKFTIAHTPAWAKFVDTVFGYRLLIRDLIQTPRIEETWEAALC